MTTDHTAIRNRTIPARLTRGLRSLSIWNLCAWLRLEDVDWGRWWRWAVVVVSFALWASGWGYAGLWLLLAVIVMRR